MFLNRREPADARIVCETFVAIGGIDPISCRHVRITNCDISTCDDGICPKASKSPCEDVVVSNCKVESKTAALKLGTGSSGDFRHIRFEHCVLHHSVTGICFELKDGGTAEDITFSDIQMDITTNKYFASPIFLDIDQRTPDSKISHIRNITMENMTIQTGSGIVIQGRPDSIIESLTLRNLTLRVVRADSYDLRRKAIGNGDINLPPKPSDTLYARLPAYCSFAYVRGLHLDDVHVEIAPSAYAAFPRSAVCGRELEDAVLSRVTRVPAAAVSVPVIDLQNCTNVQTTEQ